jgi:hypothetical protein
VVKIALAILSIYKLAGVIYRPQASIADIFDEFWRVKQFEDELRIVNSDLTEHKTGGFDNMHTIR